MQEQTERLSRKLLRVVPWAYICTEVIVGGCESVGISAKAAVVVAMAAAAAVAEFQPF